MRRMLILLAVGLGFSNFSFADVVKDVTKNSVKLAPVEWECNAARGNVDITNNTTEKQYVQIVVKEGTVGIANRTGNSCHNVSLSAHSAHASTVCILSPKESISLDNDYAAGMSSKGTYEIGFSN